MSREDGYSLMEVLVMLAITALLAASVLESVRAAASNGLRIERAAREASQPFVSLSAARRAVQGTRSDYRGGENAFSGDARGFSALTASPLVADTTALEAYSMAIEQQGEDIVLIYEDKGGRFEIERWRSSEAAFRYLGEPPRSIADTRLSLSQARQREWSSAWPQDSVPGAIDGASYYVPSPIAIELVVSLNDSADERIVFQIPVNDGPPLRAEDVF